MGSGRHVLRGTIYLLLLVTFFLGWPVFHYTVALMIALLIRHKDEPAALFAPVEGYSLRLRLEPLFARLRVKWTGR